MDVSLSPRERFNAWADDWRADWVQDLDLPNNRLRAAFDMWVFDHGLLRAAYANHHEIEPQIWRSNQPSPGRLHALAAKGLRTVVNLRGPNEWGSYHLEKRKAAELGLAFHDVRLLSRTAPAFDAVAALVKIFETAERPLLMHCKSGADRAGLGAAIYILTCGSGDVDAARTQLNWRFGHFKSAKTGVLDHVIDLYAEAKAESGIGLLDWLRRDDYDPTLIKRMFRANRASGFIVDRILGRE